MKGCRVFCFFFFYLMLNSIQSHEIIEPPLESYKILENAFSKLSTASESIEKICEKIGSLTVRIGEACEKWKLQSDYYSKIKNSLTRFIKYNSEIRNPPARNFSYSQNQKLVSLLHKKVLTNAIVNERYPLHNHRYSSFYELAQLLTSRKFKVLVETGTARNGLDNCHGDGCSTILLAKIAQLIGAKLYSVDIDPNACAISRQASQPYQSSVEIVHQDSLSFLNSFKNGFIDFLYLDSLDFDFGNPGNSQEYHRNEIIAAYNKLHKKSIVMIDDCRLLHGGKCLLVREFLLEKGWTLYLSSYQQIFIYEK